MYDGIDGWMCPRGSRCAAILGAGKCQKRGTGKEEPELRPGPRPPPVNLNIPAGETGAAHTRKILPSDSGGEYLSFYFKRVQIYQIPPVSKSPWQRGFEQAGDFFRLHRLGTGGR